MSTAISDLLRIGLEKLSDEIWVFEVICLFVFLTVLYLLRAEEKIRPTAGQVFTISSRYYWKDRQSRRLTYLVGWICTFIIALGVSIFLISVNPAPKPSKGAVSHGDVTIIPSVTGSGTSKIE
ncbi:hypothetical protein LLG95_03085 [bacterium]|nr:hypothetical protein [bacterium]